MQDDDGGYHRHTSAHTYDSRLSFLEKAKSARSLSLSAEKKRKGRGGKEILLHYFIRAFTHRGGHGTAVYRMSRRRVIAAIPGKGLTNGLLLRRTRARERERERERTVTRKDV